MADRDAAVPWQAPGSGAVGAPPGWFTGAQRQRFAGGNPCRPPAASRRVRAAGRVGRRTRAPGSRR